MIGILCNKKRTSTILLFSYVLLYHRWRPWLLCWTVSSVLSARERSKQNMQGQLATAVNLQDSEVPNKCSSRHDLLLLLVFVEVLVDAVV